MGDERNTETRVLAHGGYAGDSKLCGEFKSIKSESRPLRDSGCETNARRCQFVGPLIAGGRLGCIGKLKTGCYRLVMNSAGRGPDRRFGWVVLRNGQAGRGEESGIAEPDDGLIGRHEAGAVAVFGGELGGREQ